MKVKNLLKRIPRPAKAIFCAVCVVLLLIVYYIALGCPTTFRQEFRRAEKAHLVGPSTIVDMVEDTYTQFDKMIVGETEHGICFFGRYYQNYPYNAPRGEKHYLFSYVEKAGDLTIAAAPNVWGSVWTFQGFEQSIPVYLFTENADALRAELEISVSGEYERNDVTTQYEHTFRAEATRSESGIFRFWFSADTEKELAALYFLSNATGGSAYQGLTDKELETVFPTTVRLYGADGKLILEKQLEIHPQR